MVTRVDSKEIDQVDLALNLADDDDMNENDDQQLSDSDSGAETYDAELANLQKVNRYIRYFPNFNEVKIEANKAFEDIKANIVRSIYYNELRPGLNHWTNRLENFIGKYGLYFTKEEHIKLIKLYLELLFTKELDFPLIERFSNVLVELLKKWDKLPRKDLVIPWRPLYDIYTKINEVHDRSDVLAPQNMDNFNNLIKQARIYFPIEATKEMLDEWRPLFCPYDMSMSKACERFELFLPTFVYVHEQEQTYKLWAEEFLNLWTKINASHTRESFMILLFARLANNTVGYFDWNPYIPHIFSFILRGFGLPIVTGSKELGNNTTTAANIYSFSVSDIYSICNWIVSMINENSICMEYLKRLLKTLRSFYYPSNTGRWSSNLYAFLRCLPHFIIKRRFHEKKEKQKWYGKTPQNALLKDSEITEFVNAMKDCVFTAIFSKTNQTDAIKAFQSLCFLRPEITLPYLIDKIYNSIESLIEPHRFTTILNCLVQSSRELIKYNKYCPTMQSHVIPLLTAVLPGLDGNDLKKCLISFQFLASVLSSIPIVDCTPAIELRNDLTEQEHELCLSTAKFEDFIHEFFNKIFSLIEMLSCELFDVPMTYKTNNVDENIIEIGLTSTMNAIAQQCSTDYLKLIISKISNYISGNIYNAKAGKLVAAICKSLVKSHYGETAFKIFFNSLYENLQRIKDSKTYETILKNERGDIEVSWHIILFSELLRAHGTILVNYIDKIKDIINWYKQCTHKQTVQYLFASIRHLLKSLTLTYPTELRSTAQLLDFTDKNRFKEYLPLRDWGKNGDLNNLNIQYHIPNETEIKCAIDIVQTYKNDIFDNLKKKAEKIDKYERYSDLLMLYNLLVGASRILKRANKPSINNNTESCVAIGIGDDDVNIDMFDRRIKPDENIREDIILFCLDYTDKLLEQNTDDTKSLILICKIMVSSSVLYGYFRNEFEKRWKVYETIKQQFENKLHGKKSHTRSLLIDRILIQFEIRNFHIRTRLNELDVRVIDCLFKLATSSYSEVRKESQTQLFNMLAHYSFAFLQLVPKICGLLSNSDTINHDALKGCLYILKGNNLQSSLIVKHNWKVISELWPAVLQCKNFEKPTISALLDQIDEIKNKSFDSFSYNTLINESTVKLAFELCKPSDLNEKENRLRYFEKSKVENDQIIQDLVVKIIDYTKQSTSLWRTQEICFGSLIFLLNPYNQLSKELVQLFVESLINENYVMRRIAFVGISIILRMLKYKKPKKEYNTKDLIREATSNKDILVYENVPFPGERDDNRWHHLDNDKFSIPKSDDEWYKIRFLDKTYWGFYCWPSKLSVTESKREIFDLNNKDRKTEILKPFYDCFTDSQFIEKLFKLLKLEKEKFELKRFHLFKGIFRNFGDVLVPNLIEKLTELIRDRNKDTHEASHKLASEIMSALMRGSKYWPLTKLKLLWADLKKLFDLVIDNMSPETLKFWYNMFNTSMEDQDPRRMVFYINYMKDLLKTKLDDTEQCSSFQRSSCLHLVRAFGQFEWRIPKIRAEIFDTILPKMHHPYKAVREKLANCLALCLVYDAKIPPNKENPTTAPHVNTFVHYLETKMNESIELFKNVESKISVVPASSDTDNGTKLTDNQKNAINFIQTTLTWFVTYLTRSLQPIQYDLINLIPQLCSLDNIAAQDESTKQQLLIVRSYISIWSMDETCSNYLIKQLKTVIDDGNWHSKLAVIQIIQSFGIFNLFSLNDANKNQIKEIIVKYLTDEQLEVRLACAHTLSGFIHSSLIEVDDDLVNKFKKLSKTSSKSKDANGKSVLNMANVIKRHGGILGICAIVNSSPYEIPKYLPDLITYLCAFINDPAPIQNTVRKCLSEFRRTHHDNWQEHEQYFTEDQLLTIKDVLISPNYYA